MAISHKATLWTISENTTPLKQVFSTTQQVTDVEKGEKLTIPFYAGLEPDKEYLIECVHISNVGLESEPGSLIFTPEGVMIQAPVVTAVISNGQVPFGTAVNLTSSAFLTTPPNSASHVKTEWLVSKVGDFATTVISEVSTTKLTAFTIPANVLEADTTYYIKASYQSDGLVSPYSVPISFKVASQASDIDPPTLVSPAVGVKVDCKTFNLATGPFKNNNPAAASHTGTIWQLGRKDDFQDIAWQLESSSSKTTVTVPGEFLAPGTSYFLRVKYLSGIYSSPWSATFEVSTQDLLVTWNLLPAIPAGQSCVGGLHFFSTGGDSSLLGAGFVTSNHNSDPNSTTQTLVNITAFNPTSQSWNTKAYTEYDGIQGSNPIFFKSQRPIWNINNDFHNKMANVIGISAMTNYSMNIGFNHMFFTYEKSLSASSKESIFGRLSTSGFVEVMKTVTNNANPTALANHKEHLVKGAAGNFVYALFGDTPELTTFKKFNLTSNPTTTVWENCASLPAGAVLDTRLITFGNFLYGYGSYGTTASGKPKSALFVYGINTNTWEILPADDSPSLFFRTDAACEIVGDYFYIHGGRGATQGIVNELWRCSVISKKWAKLSSGGEPTEKHCAWSKDNKLYIGATKLYTIDLSNVPGCVAEEPPEEQVVIQKPLLTSPSDGQQLNPNDVRATCSTFSATPANVTHYSTTWEVHSNAACTQLVEDIPNGVGGLLTTCYFGSSYFSPGTTYYFRCRHNGKKEGDQLTVYSSEWSATKSFQISTQAVKPKITSPANGAEVLPTGFTITVNPYSTNPPSSDPHTRTQYQISTNPSSFANENLIMDKETTSPNEKTSVMVPQSLLAANMTYGIRVMFNKNNIWSDVVTVKTKASSGWQNVIEYDDTEYFDWTGRLLNACICSSSPIDTRQSLFIFGNVLNGNQIDPQSWEYPLDGSARRSVPCSKVDWCYFHPFLGAIYRFCFRTGNVEIDKLNLLTRQWSSVPIVDENGSSLNGQFTWAPFASVAVGKNCIVFMTYQYPIPDDAHERKPTIRIWQLFASPTQKLVAYDYWQQDFPAVGTSNGFWFSVDTLICTTPASVSGYENCVITRFSPVKDRYYYSVNEANVVTQLTKFNAYPYQYDPGSVVTTKQEPQYCWNPVFLRASNEIIWNTYRSPGAGIKPSYSDLRSSVNPLVVMDGSSLEVKRTIPKAPGMWLFANNYDNKLYLIGGNGTTTTKFYVKRYIP